MRLSLPPQYSRLLLGVVLGFILGTVLYQSQRREWNVRGDVGPINSCIENKVSNSCPSGGVNMGTYCYLPEGAPCDAFGEQGTCGAGACIPNQFACCANNMCSLQTAETCVSPSFFHTGMNCAQAQQNPLNNCGLPPCSAGMVTCSPFAPQATSPVCCATGNACNDSDDDGFYDSCLGSSSSSTTNYCCNTSNYTCYPSSSSSSSSLGCNSSIYNQCIGGCNTAPSSGFNVSSCYQSCSQHAGCLSSSSSSCGGLFAGCANGSDCCSGSCNTTGSCMCAPTGASCSNTSTGFNYCCSNTCTNGLCTTSSSSSTSPSSVGSTSSSCANINSHCGGDTSAICCDQNAECTQRPGIGLGCCFPDGTTLPIDGIDYGHCCTNQAYASNGNTICGVSSSSTPSSVGSSATSLSSISSSSSSCMSAGQYCGTQCDRCCSGNGMMLCF